MTDKWLILVDKECECIRIKVIQNRFTPKECRRLIKDITDALFGYHNLIGRKNGIHPEKKD